MAKKAPVKVTKKKPVRYKPADFIRGTQNVGDKYTAWDTYGQGKPDFGKGAGPGEPYREVSKRNTGRPGVSAVPKGVKPAAGSVVPSGGPSWIAKTRVGGNSSDPRIAAIRKRLGWG